MDESYQQRQRSCDTLQSLTGKEMSEKHKVAEEKKRRENWGCESMKHDIGFCP